MFHVYSQNGCEYHMKEYFVRHDMETLMEYDTLTAFQAARLFCYFALRAMQNLCRK